MNAFRKRIAMEDIRKKKTAVLVVGGWLANLIGNLFVAIGGFKYLLTAGSYKPDGEPLLALGIIAILVGTIALLYGIYLALTKLDMLAEKHLDTPVEVEEVTEAPKNYVDPNMAEVEEDSSYYEE